MSGRVFVLGAGASVEDTKQLDLRLPLANEFFESAYTETQFPREFGTFKRSALQKVLTYYFEAKRRPSANARLNIEDVYSFIEICIKGYPAHNPHEEPRLFEQARSELLGYIEHVMRYVPWAVEEPYLHCLIARSLGEHDSVLAFNWDLLSDKALKNAGRTDLIDDQKRLLEPAGLGVTPDRGREVEELHRGRFLKLHGSVNLAACTDADCPRSTQPFRFGLTQELLGNRACTWCGSPLEVFLVPPHIHKPYDRNRFLRLQANLAAEKLSLADEILVIGYSFPMFDFTARAMFRLARVGPDIDAFLSNARRIVIANPAVDEESYVAAIRDIFGLFDARRTHGGPVELKLYATVEELIETEATYWSAPPQEHPVARRIHAAHLRRLLRYAKKHDVEAPGE